MISHHTDHIKLTQTTTNHCVKAYCKHRASETEFCVCLTCHKGTLGCGSSTNSARWLHLHSKKTDCIAAHAGAFRILKQQITSVSAQSPIPEPAFPPPKTDSFGDLWAKWKTNTKTRALMNDIESRCKAEHVDDSDNDGIAYMFDPRKGFEYCISMTVGYKREVELLKAELAVIKEDAEREKVAWRMRVQEAETTLATIKENYNTLFAAHQQLMAQSKALTDENKQLKEENEQIKLENKRLSDRLDIVEEENKRMKERLDALEAM
jgi:hypothetical protein